MTAEKPLGILMREVREQLGMTQGQLAAALGVAQSGISRAEKGGNPSSNLVKAFCRFAAENVGPLEQMVSPTSTIHTSASVILLEEVRAACEELGQPMKEEEAAIWTKAEKGDLLAESALLREALELRTNRELLVAAQASCRRWEAKALGK